MREIRTLRAMWRVLETESRQFLNGHEEGNLGHSQGGAYGPPRQHSTLLVCLPKTISDLSDSSVNPKSV